MSRYSRCLPNICGQVSMDAMEASAYISASEGEVGQSTHSYSFAFRKTLLQEASQGQKAHVTSNTSQTQTHEAVSSSLNTQHRQSAKLIIHSHSSQRQHVRNPHPLCYCGQSRSHDRLLHQRRKEEPVPAVCEGTSEWCLSDDGQMK